MKIKTALAGLAGLVLAACTENIDLQEKVLMMGGNSLNIEVTDEFDAAATRADYSGFPSTTFETGDAIGIYAFDGSSYVTSNIRFVRQSDGSWTPDKEVPYVEGYTYYAYFPYRATVYTPSTSGDVDAVDTKFASFISDVSDYFWQADQSTKAGFTYSNLMISKGIITDTDDDAVTIKFTMHHKRGLAVIEGSISNLTFTGNIPYSVNTTKQFLMKPETATSFTDNTGSTYSLSAKAGEIVSHVVKKTTMEDNASIANWKQKPKDLSMMDNAGKERDSRTTANCYLIHEAGVYSIPLVYGNAIKNGEVNTVAFYPGKDGSISNGVDRFVNHAGTGITGPWITKNGSGVDAGMNIVVDVAELLWQDNIGLISAVDIDGDYLTFTVPADASSKAGNALIAAKSGSTIVWSWHIWITTETLSSTTVVTTDKHSYTVAPVNLGWIPTGGGGKQGYCPYYQWGRKDPFIPSTGSENTNHTMYNISNSSITGLTYKASTSATIASNIINPTYHYYNGSTYGPCKTTYYNMWDSQNSSTDINISTATKKTIYDPCPPGFCVPTGNLYNYIKTNYSTYFAWDSTNMGRLWSKDSPNVFFPASGRRTYNSGSLGSVGSSGGYWSAAPGSTNYGRYLNFTSSSTNWSSNNRAFGYPVRAVVEE